MLTKAEFTQAIHNTLGNYPTLATLYQMRDPLVLQHLEAIAAMFGLLAQQIDVASMEPFDKVRDATVLADAAMRGIIPSATPARAQISVTNRGTEAVRVDAGRLLLDINGLSWVVAAPVDVPANGTASLEASQYRAVTITHTVTDSAPFYSIEIPKADDGSHLAGLRVSDADGAFEYRERYVNTLAEERVFNIEADDRQRVYVRFGLGGVVGTQPANGTTITLDVGYSHGARAAPAYGSPFSFAYLSSPQDSYLDMQMESLRAAGQDPISMDVLRDIARYPSVYDHNAVYLGEFEFLLRRKFPTLRFLSVWNEREEELVRGASVENINTLFVAFVADSAANTAATELAIRQTLTAADDSYRVRFVAAVRTPLTVTVKAQVSTNYLPADVRQQISAVLLGAYGEDSQASRRRAIPTHQDVYALLTEKVQALRAGKSELVVTLADAPRHAPESWVYVSPESLVVMVDTMNTIAPTWGY